MTPWRHGFSAAGAGAGLASSAAGLSSYAPPKIDMLARAVRGELRDALRFSSAWRTEAISARLASLAGLKFAVHKIAAAMPLDAREVYELQQLASQHGLSAESLAQLVDASLSVPSLVRSEAAAMAAAKRAGLGMAERQLLREALRRHKADVLSAAEPAIVEITDDAEAHHVVAAQAELLEARRRAAAKADLGEEAVANGAVRPLYRWTQEPDDLTAVVLLPPGTEKRRVVCVFRPQSLVVGLRGEPPIIDAPLRGRVKVEECVWQLQDSHRLVLQMHKVAPPTPRAQGGTVDACWWPSLLQGEPDIDVDACKAGCAADLFGNSGHRLRLQKIEVPKAEGEAKYDPVKAEKAWRDFKEHFPDYEMYELNFGKEAGDERKPEEKLVDALQKQAAKDAGEWEASTAES